MTFTVDIHHLIPDFYRAATEHDGQSVGGVRTATWSPANALSFMDHTGCRAGGRAYRTLRRPSRAW